MDLTGYLVAASFSNDGEWLFAWSCDEAKYYWCIWDMRAGEIKDCGQYSLDVFPLE